MNIHVFFFVQLVMFSHRLSKLRFPKILAQDRAMCQEAPYKILTQSNS